jgi:hypothetical protein
VTAFSKQLDDWLSSRKPKTIAGLIAVSGEKSFAVVFLVLMAIPALPLPTGGLTHIFEIITMLLALELIVGRKTIWIPKKWLDRQLGTTLEKRTLPYLVRKIRWLEKYSRRRLPSLLNLRLVGLVVIVFSLGAFLAPPFSGLDTLPALGVVLVALSLILEDFALFGAAIIVGILGIILEVGFGAAIVALGRRYL